MIYRSDPTFLIREAAVSMHMVHQCVSEDFWFRTMLDIDVGAPPLPKEEARLEFMRRYEEDSDKRLAVLRTKDEEWWEGETTFFDVRRSRAWVMTRRMTHTSHHRGQQLALLRVLGREEYSNYGSNRRYWGVDAKPCPDNLRLPRPARSIRRRSRRRAEDEVARPGK